MNCPMFVDFTRECIEKIEFTPQNTLDYCESERHKECPFFRTINNVEPLCPHIKKCVVYKYLGVGDFDIFVKIADQYCLSDNRINCERFKLKSNGMTVPENLLPDGTRIKK